MKEQILAQLSETHKTIGFNEKTFGAVADYLAATIKEESEIEAAITAFAPLVKAFQGEVDRVRTQKAKEVKAAEQARQEAQEPGESAPQQAPAGDQMAALMQMVQGLAQQVQELKTGKVIETRQSKFDAVMAGASESVRLSFGDKDLTQFEDDEDFEKFLNKVSGVIQYEKNELGRQGLVTEPPVGGARVPQNKKFEATEEEMNALAVRMGLRQSRPRL